jgi:hypothetical protein
LAPPLPPRLSGPLSELSRAVTVAGVDPAAVVVVFADGQQVGEAPVAGPGLPASLGLGGAVSATVPLTTPLRRGQLVTARQVVGSNASELSTIPVTVLGVPATVQPPFVATFPVTGVEALLLQGLFPGGSVVVNVRRGGATTVRESDVADFDQIVMLPSALRTGDGVSVTLVVGSASATWSAPGAVEPWGGGEKVPLPTPVFELVPVACDRGVRLGGIVPGATAVVEIAGVEHRQMTPTSHAVVAVRSFLAAGLGDEGLHEGDDLVIWQEFPSTGQATDPGQRLHHRVGPPGPPAAPALWNSICPQSTELTVTGYRPGARIRIYGRPQGAADFDVIDELTHRAPLREPDIVPVPFALTERTDLAATQEPCEDDESPRSPHVTVTAVSPNISGQISIEQPVLQCSAGVLGINLALGASAAVTSARPSSTSPDTAVRAQPCAHEFAKLRTAPTARAQPIHSSARYAWQ